jgi:hypothetical protein
VCGVTGQSVCGVTGESFCGIDSECGDEEIVSFLCGKEGKIVVHPVRSRKCAHVQCFELDVLPLISYHLDGKGGT